MALLSAMCERSGSSISSPTLSFVSLSTYSYLHMELLHVCLPGVPSPLTTPLIPQNILYRDYRVKLPWAVLMLKLQVLCPRTTPSPFLGKLGWLVTLNMV